MGATGATFSGLPTGVNGVWASNTVTISGTPTVAGVYNYTVNLVVGCTAVSASGVITVNGLPTITAVTTASADSVSITGTNFLLNNQQPTVSIGGVAGTVLSATNTAITVRFSSGTIGGDVLVTSACGTNSPPFAFNYSAPTMVFNPSEFLFTQGVTITPITPQLSGNPANSFAISPALPSGLVLNTTTGSISGKPTVAIAQTNYTVTATNIGGSSTATIKITVAADTDGDGIRDAIDLCPNSTPGAMVDFNGCEIFILPSNNYAVMATATSCVGQQNGAISVSATNTNYTYTVTINGQAAFELNSSNNFKNQVQNLAPGNYEVCISIVGKTNYLQCYTVKITEPTPLSATNKIISANGKQVTYTLSDATTYVVTLNGITQNYTANQITLDLALGQNTIKLATDVYCQGSYLDTIFVSEKAVLYPNPANDYAQIYIAGTEESVTVTLTNFSGQIITSAATPIPPTRTIELNVSQYPSGIYLVHLEGTTLNETVKLIKK